MRVGGVVSIVGGGTMSISVVFNLNSSHGLNSSNNSDWLHSRDELGGVTITIVSVGSVESALLPGHLS